MTSPFDRVETERLVLRRVRPGDTADVLRIHGDPATNLHNPDGPLHDESAARALIEEWLERWARNGVGYWAIERAEDGRLVGFGGVSVRSAWEGRPVLNVYYRLAPEAWGSGYATEMTRAAVELARREFPELPLVVRTMPANGAAIRIAERLGFDRRPELDDGHVVYALGWAPSP